MAKRKPLVAPDALSDELKKSAGRGLGALFTPAPPDEVQPEAEERVAPETVPKKQARQPREKRASAPENKQTIQQESNVASNITILQFDQTEINQLREPAYKAQTFRFTERDIEWVRDVSYQLSKEFRRGKVSQADILRIALKLLEHALATNKAEIVKILEAIK
jgi:hypothetical protein